MSIRHCLTPRCGNTTTLMAMVSSREKSLTTSSENLSPLSILIRRRFVCFICQLFIFVCFICPFCIFACLFAFSLHQSINDLLYVSSVHPNRKEIQFYLFYLPVCLFVCLCCDVSRRKDNLTLSFSVSFFSVRLSVSSFCFPSFQIRKV